VGRMLPRPPAIARRYQQQPTSDRVGRTRRRGT
ncbi:uncharacterized protein METZ01_LOCUS57836, partial [marine metagenome]